MLKTARISIGSLYLKIPRLLLAHWKDKDFHWLIVFENTKISIGSLKLQGFLVAYCEDKDFYWLFKNGKNLYWLFEKTRIIQMYWFFDIYWLIKYVRNKDLKLLQQHLNSNIQYS